MVQQSVPPVKLFDALGDPNRFQIFEMLSSGDRAISEIGEALQISLPATLKHLRILEEVGLAKTSKVGRERRCRLDVAPLNELIDWASHVRSTWNLRIDSLERFLAVNAGSVNKP
jgi:DNA-binding transcriptional ArsR family regulator